MLRPPPRPPLFPPPTPFRSGPPVVDGAPRLWTTPVSRRRPALPSRHARSARSPCDARRARIRPRSEEHTSELQSRQYLVCRLLLEKTKELHSRHPLVCRLLL